MNSSPDQNHLNCHDECIHRIDIIACGCSIQPSYLEFILPNLHLLTLIAFLQSFSGGFFWRQLKFVGTGSTLFSARLFWRQLTFRGNWLYIIFRRIVFWNLEGTGSALFSGRLDWRQLRFGGNLLHIIFRQIVLEAAQIRRELAPQNFPKDCFGGRSNLEGTGSTLFSGRLFWKFGGNWFNILFRRIVLEAAQI